MYLNQPIIKSNKMQDNKENKKEIIKQVYILENLHCANCAAKMERKINELDEVAKVSIVTTTKKMYIESYSQEDFISKLQDICTKIESNVVVTKDGGVKKYTFSIDKLNCAHCAGKIEEKFNTLDGIIQANLVFTTKRLLISASEAPDLAMLNQVADHIEKGVVIKKINTKSEVIEVKDNETTYIVVGMVLFFLAIIITHVFNYSEDHIVVISLYLVAYLILGTKVLLKAFSNMRKGQVFDEHFLMSIATLGALLIGEFSEAVGVMLFFRVGSRFEHVAVEKSRKQIMDTIDLREDITHVNKNGKIIDMASEDVKVNDLIVVKVGERIPLDAIVVEGVSYVDTSTINGEPLPIKVRPNDKVYSGYLNTSAMMTLRVEKVLSESMVTKILNAVENAAASKPKIDHFITRFARVYTPIVVVVALFTAVAMPLILSEPMYPWVYTALSFLVMSCPCALILSVPLAYYCGIGALSKQKILCKGGSVLESLAAIKIVIMDKTGTISKGEFVVQKIETHNNYTEEDMLSLVYELEKNSNHPIAKSVVNYIETKSIIKKETSKIQEVSGKGMKALIDNKVVLVGNNKLMQEHNIPFMSSSTNVETEVFVAYDGNFVGCVLISDTIKEEATQAIDDMHKLNLKTAMLSGDRYESANHTAQLTHIQTVRAELLPNQKFEEMEKLRDEHGSCLFVGDGINDSIVLAGANVGAAMGSGSDAAIDVADVVFMNSNLDAINKSIRISKTTTAIAKQNVVGALSIKIIVMILGVTGIYSNMWLAVFADTGVAFICILNSIRILYRK